ncbi:TPA: hypothetical protein N0F65_001975 [Lagenidium giganteum]|uniref:Uncharacterized protein n=1 Tax=Lagenidium giganteum TaxID=4803 RepID=A0AAV2YKH7_9STRA|nr:TPA: hypothetical protein N0F65_001975 [Lagenidium giganteum]
MKTVATTTALFAAIAALTIVAPRPAHAAGSIKATCLYTNGKCSGGPMLRYYEDTGSCTEDKCIPLTIEGSSDFSNHQICTDDIAEDADSMLGTNPYVLVQQYASGCTGKISNATAVVADGKCYPFIDGKSSYMAEIGDDKAVNLIKFASSGKCEGDKTTMKWTATDADGKKCVDDNLKIIAKASAAKSKGSKPSGSAATAGSGPAKASSSPAPKTSDAAVVGVSMAGALLAGVSVVMHM